MVSCFLPRLINDPFDDPGLYIPILFEKRALIFDLGDIYALSAKDTLKISHVFITHTHMDHFVGFDRMLRLFLGREKELHIFGPPGFLKNLEGKLSGYSWNLVENFDHRFTIHAAQIDHDYLLCKSYRCQDGFSASGNTVKKPFSSVLLNESVLSVHTALLDHSIVSLGFTVKERFHVNIKKDAVISMGLEIGPWLKRFKAALYSGASPDSKFEITVEKPENKQRQFVLGELAEQIAHITPGQKIAYISDVVYTRKNMQHVVELVDKADHLFIEAVFLDEDKDAAQKKHHLTAGQAGHVAGLAGVKRFTLFHHSPRYTGRQHLFQEEALCAYQKALKE